MSLVEKLNAVLTEADNQLIAYEDTMSTLKENVTTLTSDNDSKQAKINELSSQLETANQTITSQDAQIVAFEAELDRPKPSGISKVIPNLNEWTTWLQPTNAGDSGGSDPSKASGKFIMTPGTVALYTVQGAYKYNNAYWYKKWYQRLGGNRFVYALDVMFPMASDVNACQALEFELQKNEDDYVYNMAWQCHVRNRADKSAHWRTFDFTNKVWEETNVNTTVFNAGFWHSFVAEFYADYEKKTLTHLSLSIDGEIFNVNVTRPATPLVQNDYLSVGFQLDCDGNTPPTPYSAYTRNMHVLY